MPTECIRSCFGMTTRCMLHMLITTPNYSTNGPLPPDDPTLIGHLMACAATTLDRCEAARRRKLPFFGSSAKMRELDRRQMLERVAAQRVALSAARVGLPQVRVRGWVGWWLLWVGLDCSCCCAKHRWHRLLAAQMAQLLAC